MILCVGYQYSKIQYKLEDFRYTRNPLAKAAWLSGYSGKHRTKRFWVQNPHMLPSLVSQGDVMVPCKPELGLATPGQGEEPSVVKLNIMGIPGAALKLT